MGMADIPGAGLDDAAFVDDADVKGHVARAGLIHHLAQHHHHVEIAHVWVPRLDEEITDVDVVFDSADTAFAVGACGRTGYEILEAFTDVAPDLHLAVDSTTPCGATPLWESTCCAMGTAADLEPSNTGVLTRYRSRNELKPRSSKDVMPAATSWSSGSVSASPVSRRGSP